MKRAICLTDEQYEACLCQILDTVEAPGFRVEIDDSDHPGNKYSRASFGFCDERTLSRLAGVRLFPDHAPQTPQATRIKYRQAHHRCPFDGRTETEVNKHGGGWDCGCYFRCLGRRGKRKGPMTPAAARAIVRNFLEAKRLRAQCPDRARAARGAGAT